MNSKTVFTSIKSRLSFIPSIDLVKAVIRQRDFLRKIQTTSFIFMDFQHW